MFNAEEELTAFPMQVKRIGQCRSSVSANAGQAYRPMQVKRIG